jgi:hypothetical protein
MLSYCTEVYTCMYPLKYPVYSVAIDKKMYQKIKLVESGALFETQKITA